MSGRSKGVGMCERRWGVREALGRRRREWGGCKGEMRAKGGAGCGVWGRRMKRGVGWDMEGVSDVVG